MARTTEIEGRPEHHVSIVRKAFAGAVLIVAAVLILKLVIGFVIAIFWGAVVVAAVIAVLWALKQIVW
jgi:flagellar biosynthesis protein FliQ